MSRQHYEPKELFVERMTELLGEESEKYFKSLNTSTINSIRVNTLKISPEKLKKRIEEKKWIINQPFKNYPEILVIENNLMPGELGRSIEHLLGYYYVQEISSMLPIIALNPKPNESLLDLCAAPGSKTTQAAAKMENTGNIIANELQMGRIKVLASNLQRCGVSNTTITKKEGQHLCQKLNQQNFKFDKILIDAPCSGEGTIKSTPKTLKMWNIHTVKKLSKIQKQLVESAIEILNEGGEMVYSTCTHSPEENEEIVNFILENFPEMEITKIELPKELKTRPGILNWQEKEYLEDVKLSCRVYPQDNNTEGFFLAKFKKKK